MPQSQVDFRRQKLLTCGVEVAGIGTIVWWPKLTLVAKVKHKLHVTATLTVPCRMPPKIIPKWKKDSKKTGESPKNAEWESNIQDSNIQVF